MSKKSDSISCCSFCGRPEADVEKLIAGPNVYICDRCVALCSGILDKKPQSEEEGKESVPLVIPDLKPKEIKAKLDEYIIGQEAAKRVIAVSVYNHYKRVMHHQKKNKEL